MDYKEKVPSDATIALIADYLSEMKLHMPLDGPQIETAIDFFEDLEISLSEDQAEGKKVDRTLLFNASEAVDDLAICDDGDYLDYEKLNSRVEKYLQSKV